MSLADQLALAEMRLRDDMPEEFDDDEEIAPVAREPAPAPAPAPQRRVPPAVSRPTGALAQTPRRASVWDQIDDPAERRELQKAYEHFKTANQDPDMPASEFVTIYLDPRADALELRRQRKKA